MDTSVDRRLRPLLVAAFFAAFVLWFPVEKLFLSQIGFTPVTIGLMAAVYAAVVPLFELPSGVLADRWSRRGVLVLSTGAAAATSIVGGLSDGVGLYLLSAAFLGVTFALASGSLDAMVYDTLLEETGHGAGFTRQIGRVRLAEGLGLTAGALGGGLLAELTSPRATYFATVPLVLLAAVAALRFREPTIHAGDEVVGLRDQVRATVQALGDRDAVLPAILLGAVGGVTVQLVLEFGPLWLVATDTSAVAYGPYSAVVFGVLGVGALAAARVSWRRRSARAAVAGGLLAAALVATVSRELPVIVAAHASLVLGLAMVAVHASQRLNDATQSTVRSGVLSGASTMTWLTFVPASLVFGALVEAVGVLRAAWMVVGLVALTGGLLVRSAPTVTPATALALPSEAPHPHHHPELRAAA